MKILWEISFGQIIVALFTLFGFIIASDGIVRTMEKNIAVQAQRLDGIDQRLDYLVKDAVDFRSWVRDRLDGLAREKRP